MSNVTNPNPDDDDLDEDETPADANGPKALRDQAKKLARELKAAQVELNTLRAERRAGSLAEHLKANGAKPGLAKYAAQGIEGDITAESVKKWLETEGDNFGWTAPDADDEDDDTTAVATQARRMSAATRQAPEAKTGWTAERMANATDQELLDAGILTRR